MTVERVVAERLVAGGDALARRADGRIVFVAGALPGEEVDVTITEERRGFARADLVAVHAPSPDRVEPPCPFVAAGCGGCGWQHLALDAQRAAKRDLVADALHRLAKLDVPVEPVVALPDRGYRTSVRVMVRDGRPAFRRARSHDPIAVDRCLVAHPLLDELLGTLPTVLGPSFAKARELELRAGARTGERVLGLPGRTDEHHEVVAGFHYRISGGAFFQVRADGAEVLVDRVRGALAGSKRVADLYAGVGLFAVALAADGATVVAVEANPVAARDARHNAARNGELPVRVVRSDVTRWNPARVDGVVADPSRDGLGRAGADVVAGTGARTAVLVSCDVAAMARDVGLLVARGFSVARVEPVDLFPHTPHVEVVTTLVRGRAA